ATEAQIQSALAKIQSLGYTPHLSRGTVKTICGVTGDDRSIEESEFDQLPGVESVLRVLKPYKLASREFHPDPTVVDVGGVPVGEGSFVVIAGPCSVEDEAQLESAAAFVAGLGLKLLRGGAFKPRSSPYSFQGLGEQGLEILCSAARRHGLTVVTEILSEHDVELVGRYTGVFQVGARNMQNFALLKALGETRIPVLLKRSMMGTIEELLLSAEYIMKGGNPHVILCERGIRTFETETRNTLDIGAVPAIKRLSHLPILVDPSHAMGDWHYVPSASMAALAAGADGIIIEIHPNPVEAKSDGKQSLNYAHFEDLLGRLKDLAPHLGATVR
ncbi:MAG TPA: 3-deoxy-7-phosphoheptulonate synthase, partial [Spirochaetia bacterium]|nr:3-deoxy-7-phosphoheptulonate synthase [Spirochaetia bacterium]